MNQKVSDYFRNKRYAPLFRKWAKWLRDRIFATRHQKDGILPEEQEYLGIFKRADGKIDFMPAARTILKRQGIDITDEIITTFYNDITNIQSFYEPSNY